MKIAIDISQIIYGTGVSVYTENLAKNLSKIDSENKYILFGGSLRRLNDIKEKTKGLGRNFIAKLFPIPPTVSDLIWNRLHILPIEWLVGKVDVFHSSDWTQPPSRAFKVTTVHDLSPIIFPESTKKDVIRNIPKTHMARLNLVKKEVDRIIVPSNATKKDLLEMNFNEAKIRIIPEAVEEEFKPATNEEIDRAKRKFNLTRPYLLTIGVGGRKNTDNLVRAFENVRAKQRLDLILVGGGSYNADSTRGTRPIGHITNPELSAIYSGAEALVYPSLYEGFGLPILQAFACGCPVLTSNISSMPEVAGDAAVLVDPKSVDSITEGIRMVLKEKEDLIKKGFKRVKDFSWEKTARETLKVYNEARNL